VNLNSILTIGNAGEDPPSDGAKGELFFDIDDNKLYINKDSTTNGWVTVSSSNTASINSKIEVSEIIDGEKKIYENKWIKSEELTFVGESNYEMFGLQVDINNNFALITQFKNDSNGNPGAIKGLHVYKKVSNNWNYLYYLYHSESIDSNTFGQYPIEIKGSNIAVALNGMVFIYQLIDGNWGKSVDDQDYRVENYKLYTSDRDTNNLLPYNVTMGDKYLAISSGGELNKVYIYNFDETTGLWGIAVTGQDYRIENYIINSPQSDSRVKFGSTTSINNNYIAIGTKEQIQEKVPEPPRSNYDQHGAIYIYKRNDSDGTWTQIQKLVSSYDTIHHFDILILKDNFLIAEDSNFAENGIDYGQVLVFNKNSDDTWGEAVPGYSFRYQSSILRDGTGNGNRFGGKLSYNDDTLAVYSSLNTVNSIGAVYIFNRDPITGIFGLKVDGDDSYTIPNQEIINPEISPFPYSSFGFSLSISNKELLIGSYGYGENNSYKGKTYLYKKYSVINSDNFNGKNAIIENAVIDDLVSNKLTNLNNKTIFENSFNNSLYTAIRDPTGSEERRFGIDMDISEKYMIIGSTPKQSTKDGKFHIYNINNDGSLSFSTTITDPEVNNSHTSFGRAVAINDKYAVVGDYRPSSGNSGKVYIYKENNGDWSADKEISSSDDLTNAYFGIEIAINSKYIAVGASLIGEVFLYELDSDGNWGIDGSSSVRNNNYKLLPSNTSNNFGNSIAMSEKYIVVGSYANQTAYVYEMHSDGKWGIPVSGQTYRYENSQLKGSTITNNNTGEFGRSVATYGEYVVVGAQSKRHTTNTNDNGQGAAFIYEKINDGWIELHEIKALSGDKENFSNSIYLNDRYIIVGAFGNPYASNHPSLSPPHGGVAYIFEKNLNTGKWGNSVNGETYMTESFKITNTDWGNKEYISNYDYSYKNSEYKFGWKVLINNKGAYISAPVPFTPSQDIYSYKGIVYLSSNLINCDFINIGTDFSNSEPEYKLKIISSGETMYDYSDKPYYGFGLYLKCEANHYGRAAVFETSQTAGSHSYRGYLFSHSGSLNEWNAGKAENGCGIFVIDSQGPSNDSNNFNASYYNDGCSFLVGNNLSNSKDKRFNFIVKQNGQVGIGTSGPGYPLEVSGYSMSGTQSGTTTIAGYAYPASGVYYNHSNNEYVSIRSQYAVWAQAFMATSDERIKENIRQVNDNEALQKLRAINCVNYEYKDKVVRGTDTTIGFIAQQVREHVPMAVSIQQDIIPNEMRVIETPQWTEINDGSNNKFKLTITDLEDVSGNPKYRFYVSNDLSGNNECEKEIHSLEDEPNSFIFDQSWNNVFLYGKEVDDFHTLDKQKLFALNFSATQEIDRIQQTQIVDISLNKLEINEAKQKIQLLEEQNSNLLTRLEALEKKINDLS
jgi:hypothetical protein